ncbi:hypothetical protein [Croceivirga sp. JEA036]|uniref:hypothetical protein n=1 Tax=Croceivirga sp. JEA036 TaxID=2721162 RepID=UPI001439101A|nr:hypothetical protein [Croceivirga sp. JEA036]NJB35941.1 hypothetical protein [Croceivirga sp. JEA036]
MLQNTDYNYHLANESLTLQQTPVFFNVYDNNFETIDRSKYPWHLKLIITSEFNPFQIQSFKNEMDVQHHIEEYLTANISRFTIFTKLAAVFDNHGNIVYHWYLQDPVINVNFEEIQDIREIEVSLYRDNNWHSNDYLISYLEKDKQFLQDAQDADNSYGI